jgi:hypothetical protein
MIAQRRRSILFAVLGLAVAWAVALTGYSIAKHSKVTAEKVAVYMREVNLSRLSREGRAKAFRDLAKKMNALSIEERRRARLDGEWEQWFAAMDEEEKATFLESTLPSGFKQMLNAFEQMPEAKRRQAIDRTMRELSRAREAIVAEDPGSAPWRGRTNHFGQLSPDLQKKVVSVGLKSFYNDSSAQTRAELAPVIEEMQRLMESGVLLRGGHH